MSYSEKQGKELPDYYRDAIKAGSKHALIQLIELSNTSGKAAFYVAQLYEHDLKQMERALSFYEKASQHRYGEATHNLGKIYAEGRTDIAVDIAKASRYYITASQQGYSSSISSLQSLAQRGHAEAQYILGHEYYRTFSLGRKNNVAQYDISNAIIWCVKAEIQGHQGAASFLRGTFSKEISWEISKQYAAMSQDKDRSCEKAVEYAIKASNLGCADASEYLATTYYQGTDGIAIDRIKSYRYFVLAIKQGKSDLLQTLEVYAHAHDKEAQYALYEYYRDNKHEQLSLKWLVRASLSNHSDAKQKLKETFSAEQHWIIASLYLENGLTQEDSRWQSHCQKAADKGHAQAAFYLAQQSEGIDETHHRSSIVARYHKAAKLYNVEAKSATDRLSNELIYTSQNSGTLFASSNGARAGSATRQLSSIQQKMKRK